MAIKVCRTCKLEKESTMFDKNPTGTFGVRGTCKVCRSSDKFKIRRQNIKAKYGITMEDFIEMYERQNGLCEICDRELDMFSTRDRMHHIANIDHCHKTKKIRSILCNYCNTGLGKFMDDASLLIKASNYLKKYQ
jgi:hypothetical protein